MTVRYSPRIARWLAEREGKKLDADGGLTLEYPLADESWAIRHVLQYGPDAEILSPARLRQQLVAKLASI
jgi:predicted DNA-binding transcriptional regulator YafY